MKDDLLKIIQHYGVNHQQRKFNEEVFELQEAINTYELKETVQYEIPLTEIIGTKEHITEEIADCLVLLKQFQVYYDISAEQIKEVMRFKTKRQLERMKNE